MAAAFRSLVWEPAPRASLRVLPPTSTPQRISLLIYASVSPTSTQMNARTANANLRTREPPTTNRQLPTAILFVQDKRPQHVACADDHILQAIEFIRDRTVTHRRVETGVP